jgi:hypothetical protein
LSVGSRRELLSETIGSPSLVAAVRTAATSAGGGGGVLYTMGLAYSSAAT